MTTPTGDASDRISPRSGSRQRYLRPIILAVLFSTVAEFIIFLVFGLWMNGIDNWVEKLIWAVGFCGVGMGCALGAFIDLVVVDRWNGIRAVLGTTVLSAAILGVACNALCFQLDRGFHYFGAAQHPLLFAGNGLVGSLLGGLVIGMLLFTEAGRSRLDRITALVS